MFNVVVHIILSEVGPRLLKSLIGRFVFGYNRTDDIIGLSFFFFVSHNFVFAFNI